jgi:NTE family protein
VTAEKVAVVLAGGGARGAYEAGALSILVPELERHGQRPSIVLGTSVGALNAAFVAATAHLPVDEVIAAARDIWSTVSYDQVLAPLASPGTVARLVGYLGEALGVPGAHVWSLLDPAPLRATLGRRIDFAQIAANVASGVLHAAAVVGTDDRTLRSTVWYAGGPAAHAHDDARGIDYVPVELRVDHVLASAAIPAVFPAVEVDGRWYSDGGTRLNTPIKPALELGADRVVVVGLNSLAPGDFAGRPDALAGAGSILQSLLADQLLQDVETLRAVNAMVTDAGRPLAGRREIPFVLVAPERPDTIGTLAARVFREHYSGPLDTIRHKDLATLGRAVAGGADPAHGELLSYLFFAPEFTRALLDLGRQDAERALRSGLWRTS